MSTEFMFGYFLSGVSFHLILKYDTVSIKSFDFSIDNNRNLYI